MYHMHLQTKGVITRVLHYFTYTLCYTSVNSSILIIAGSIQKAYTSPFLSYGC